tara:strand:- start:3 stop:1217 length:1215 start_codon:yes stop_codon:yes gene_type:complete
MAKRKASEISDQHLLIIYSFDTECTEVLRIPIQGDKNVIQIIDTSASMNGEKQQTSLTRLLNASIEEEGLNDEKKENFKNSVKMLSPNGGGTHLVKAVKKVYSEFGNSRIVVFTDGEDNDSSIVDSEGKRLSLEAKADKIQNECDGVEFVWILLADKKDTQMEKFKNALIQKKGTYAVLLTDHISPREAKMLVKASKKETRQDRNVTGCLVFDEEGYGEDIEQAVPEDDYSHLNDAFDFSLSSDEVSEAQRYRTMTKEEVIECVQEIVKGKLQKNEVFKSKQEMAKKITTIILGAISLTEEDVFEPCQFWGKRAPMVRQSNSMGGSAIKGLLNASMSKFSKGKLRLFIGKHKEDAGVKRVRYDLNPVCLDLCTRIYNELKCDAHVGFIREIYDTESESKKIRLN